MMTVVRHYYGYSPNSNASCWAAYRRDHYYYWHPPPPPPPLRRTVPVLVVVLRALVVAIDSAIAANALPTNATAWQQSYESHRPCRH